MKVDSNNELKPTCSWHLTGNGEFTVKSAYMANQHSEWNNVDKIWQGLEFIHGTKSQNIHLVTTKREITF